MGAGWLLEAEKGTSLLVDPCLAVNGVPRVLHVPFYDATWRKRAGCVIEKDVKYPFLMTLLGPKRQKIIPDVSHFFSKFWAKFLSIDNGDKTVFAKNINFNKTPSLKFLHITEIYPWTKSAASMTNIR